jgi:hypothetical protein
MMKKRQKTFVKIRVIRGLTFVWDFEPLYFEFVSDFGFRISDLFFPLRGPSRSSRQLIFSQGDLKISAKEIIL